MITKDITIEDLTDNYPKSVKYLSEKGIRCIRCGEPIWGTLEEACLEKGFDESAIEKAVNELNKLHKISNQKTETDNKIIKVKKI